MTRVVLIHAGPTPWDEEDRIVGSHTLPLTPEADLRVREIVATFPWTISSIYRDKTNESAEAVARLVTKQFKLRARHDANLGEVNLGLWQGLRREELRHRFPSVFPVWEKNPLAVHPPDGETLSEAVARIDRATRKILRQNRGLTTAIALRPMAMRIVAGLVRGQTAEQIASHLHEIAPLETIEIGEPDVQRMIA